MSSVEVILMKEPLNTGSEYMERRHSPRVPIRLNAEVKTEGKTYAGVIDNISEEGMEYLITSYIEATGEFQSEQKVEMKFRAPSGETVDVDCEVRWSMENAADERVLIVGMKILDPPSRYRELIEEITIHNSDDSLE